MRLNVETLRHFFKFQLRFSNNVPVHTETCAFNSHNYLDNHTLTPTFPTFKITTVKCVTSTRIRTFYSDSDRRRAVITRF